MSASPSGMSNGRTPTPGSGPPQFIRKPKAADPLRPRKKPVQRRPLPTPGAPLKPNGHVPGATTNGAPKIQKPLNNGLQRPALGKPTNGALTRPSGGWTVEPQGPYQDFPLIMTKKDLMELRYHAARFASKRAVDPTNQDEFTRPVSLHRRDPRQPPPGKKEEEEEDVKMVDDKEREKQELARLEKEAQRAADLAQIAPTSSKGTTKKPFRQEKTSQVFRLDRTEEQKRQSDIRYEEALPWHLEDADNKQTWVGNYEAALSHSHVALVRENSRFRVIPLEKWYKFTSKAQFKVLSIEEAEAQMKKKMKESRWFMKTQELQQQDREQQATRESLGRMFTVKSESNTFRRAAKGETADMDDLDFEDDLFADDEEHMTVERERDEDTKETEDRIKREQLGANLFGEGNEAEVEKEMKKEEREAEERRRLGKSVKKALQKREKNYIYDSDSDHKYSSSSDDDTTDSEAQKAKEDERRKEEEARLKAKGESANASGTSTKGSNTPSGRPKTINALKQTKGVKRSGSPNLSASELSGNESSRKKAKKKHGLSSSQPSGTSTPTGRPGATSSSQPADGANSRKSSIVRLNLNPSKLSGLRAGSPSGAGSDGEVTAGEMSDGGRKKTKLKIHSATASRAASPAAGSAVGSPAASSGAKAPITAAEVAAALRPQGSSIQDLMRAFSSRVTDKTEFIRLVKENSIYDPATKLLRPRS